MIRRATLEDLPALMEMGRKFHAASPWRDVPLDEVVLVRNMASFVDSPNAAVFITDDGKGCIGVIGSPLYFAAENIAQEVFWWCESPGNALALMRAAEKWASDEGCIRMTMIRIDGMQDERLDRLYKREGYSPTEHYYMKDL